MAREAGTSSLRCERVRDRLTVCKSGRGGVRPGAGTAALTNKRSQDALEWNEEFLIGVGSKAAKNAFLRLCVEAYTMPTEQSGGEREAVVGTVMVQAYTKLIPLSLLHQHGSSHQNQNLVSGWLDVSEGRSTLREIKPADLPNLHHHSSSPQVTPSSA